ncbi:branched-chain amino acid ABC transporter permease [Elioraea rosea]|uniref:branched-chain amino acid ABC transporter permease n=1 Tax=Elioraea rosea TaxID=2492390 RepID=UPI0013159052|nr:branched-chain amino acid ABC transporter permease [Elioraea rosea]
MRLLPAWLRASPRLWSGVALLGLVPLITRDAYVLQVLSLAMIWAIFASSWNLAVGYAGLKTFGHQAFFGIGAYVSALSAMHGGLSPWVTMWFGAVAAAVVGALVCLPLLRIRSLPHLAIVTLAFAEIVRILCSNLVDLTRGELGLAGIPPFTPLSVPGLGLVSFGPADRASTFVLIWSCLAASLAFLGWLVRSRTGLIIQAIRDSQVAAESLGVSLTRYKLFTLTISAFLAGAVGAVYAHFVLVLTPTSALGIALMVQMTAITLVGGIGTLQGPLIGSLVLTVSAEGLRMAGDHRMLAFGVLIVLVVLFAPRGLARLDLLFGRPSQAAGAAR